MNIGRDTNSEFIEYKNLSADERVQSALLSDRIALPTATL